MYKAPALKTRLSQTSLSRLDYTNLKTCTIFFFFLDKFISKQFRYSWIYFTSTKAALHAENAEGLQSAAPFWNNAGNWDRLETSLLSVTHLHKIVTHMGGVPRSFQNDHLACYRTARFMSNGNATLSTQTTKHEISLLWPDNVLIALKRARLLIFFHEIEYSRWSPSKIK